MESAVQHGAAAFVAGLQATGAQGNPAQARGAWGCGKRSAFPTSPHPRRRLRTNFKRGATLTIYLVQKIGQVTSPGSVAISILLVGMIPKMVHGQFASSNTPPITNITPPVSHQATTPRTKPTIAAVKISFIGSLNFMAAPIPLVTVGF